MLAGMSQGSAALPTQTPLARDFWRGFLVPNFLLVMLWWLLEGLTFPDDIVPFYIVSIGAIFPAVRLGIVAGWRIAARAWREHARWLVPIVLLIALPATAIALWGAYCLVWLALLFFNGGL